jgi:hypothetical protein
MADIYQSEDYGHMAAEWTPTGPGTEKAAHRLHEAIRLRAARAEATGILRSWGGSDSGDRAARTDRNSDSEAARMRAKIDCDADPDIDPDFES